MWRLVRLLKRGSEQDEREVGYSPRGEEVPSVAPTRKKGHRERLTMVETRLDVIEASVEELYQGRGRKATWGKELARRS
ncbi:hypothetical protein BHM03_00051824 [Ensete ventricosum]|nr:hypothetical protein BHM03_00051824 [Ensete ventricosum]